MKMMIEEWDTIALSEVIGLLDVMIDLGAAQTDADTIQLSHTSFIDTLSMIKERLKTVELKLTPML